MQHDWKLTTQLFNDFDKNRNWTARLQVAGLRRREMSKLHYILIIVTTLEISLVAHLQKCVADDWPLQKNLFFLFCFFYYWHNVTVVMPGSTAVMHFASAQSVVDEKEQSREKTNKTAHVVESLLGFLSPSTGRITKREGGGKQDLKYQHNLHHTTSIKKKLGKALRYSKHVPTLR